MVVLAATVLLALSSSTLVTANVNARHHAYVQRRDNVLKRQATSSLPAPTGSSSTVAGSVSQTVATSQAVVTTPTVAGTYIPALSELTSNAPIQTPLTMFTTFAAGVAAPYSGAPALPAATGIVATKYPELDAIPDVNSAQVKQWLAELDLSGVPKLAQTVDGSCGSNPDFAKDTTRCWWTCGGCTRSTDIVTCPDKMDWGVSYDDGPSPWTPKLINYLHDKNVTATFYVVGSRAVSRPEMVQTEYMLGHEISIHTWSHTPLTTLTNEQIVAELGWTRQVIKDIIGVSPRTMRPPYGDIDDRVRGVISAMGLVPVMWTQKDGKLFDTEDYEIPAGRATGTTSFAAWKEIEELAPTLDTGFIVLEHDLYQQAIDLAVGYIIPEALTHTPKFALSSVIECQNEPASNAYSELYKNATSSGSGGTTSSGNGTTGTTESGALRLDSMSFWTLAVGAAVAGAVVLL